VSVIASLQAENERLKKIEDAALWLKECDDFDLKSIVAAYNSENRAMGFLAVQYLNADKSLPEIRDKALLDLKELLEEK